MGDSDVSDLIKKLTESNNSNERIDVYNDLLTQSLSSSSSSLVNIDNIDIIIKQYGNVNDNDDEEILIVKFLVNITASSSLSEVIGKAIFPVAIKRLSSLSSSSSSSSSSSLSIKTLQWKILSNLSSDLSLLSLISSDSNILNLIKCNTNDVNCLELAWKLSKHDDNDVSMASSELGLINELVITIKEGGDAKIMAIKIISNIAMNKSTQLYLSSADLGLLTVFVHIISNDKGDAHTKVLGIIQTLSRNKKAQQYLSSKELGLVAALVPILENNNESTDAALKIIINLSSNEANNEYLISSTLGLLSSLKKFVITSDNPDASAKAWDITIKLLPDIESRIPFLGDILIEDNHGIVRLNALDELQLLAKQKEYHQAMIACGLFRSIYYVLSLDNDKAKDARTRVLIITQTITKLSKGKAGIDSNFKEVLLRIAKDKHEDDSKTALAILVNTATTNDDFIVILFVKISKATNNDKLNVLLKELLRLTADGVKIDINDINTIVNKYKEGTDEALDQLLLSIFVNISKSQDMLYLENLLGTLFVPLLDRLNAMSSSSRLLVWKIMNNLADSDINKKTMGFSHHGLIPIIVNKLPNDNDIDCLSLIINLSRNMDNRVAFGDPQLGLCSILMNKMKQGKEVQKLALGILRKLLFVTENRVTLGTPEFVAVLSTIVKEDKGDILISAIIILTKLSIETNINIIIKSNVYVDIVNFIVQASKESTLTNTNDCASRSINFLMSFTRFPDAAANVINSVPQAVEVLTSLLTSSSSSIIMKLKAAFIVSNLTGREEGNKEKRALLATVPGLSTILMDVFTNTLDGKGGTDYALGIFELPSIVTAIRSLSISDTNKEVLVKLPLVPLLVKVLVMFRDNLPELVKGHGNALGGGNDVVSADAAIQSLLQLSYYYDNDKDLQNNYMPVSSNVPQVLSDLLQSQPNRVSLGTEAKQCAADLLKRLTSTNDNVAKEKEASSQQTNSSNDSSSSSSSSSSNDSSNINTSNNNNINTNTSDNNSSSSDNNSSSNNNSSNDNSSSIISDSINNNSTANNNDSTTNSSTNIDSITSNNNSSDDCKPNNSSDDCEPKEALATTVPPTLSISMTDSHPTATSPSLQPFPPVHSPHSISSPISQFRILSALPTSSSSSPSTVTREEALYIEVQSLRAEVKALENSSHAWRILNDSTKIKSDNQKPMISFMDDLGLHEAIDLTTLSKKHATELACYLKPVPACRFESLLFP